jgi:hypothetical protein
VPLSVFERIVLINVLPREGDFRTLKILRELREALAFSEEENAALQFQTGSEGLVRWQAEADVPKDVPIGEIAHGVIVDTLRRLDASKKLKEEHMGLYERFVEGAAAPLRVVA